jgi:hypothetical protein
VEFSNNNRNQSEGDSNTKKMKSFLNKIEESKKYESKLLYSGLAFIAFFVYTLSYVFFYGYYFSGQSDEPISMVKAFLNPVPFNFKSLTIIGLFLIIVLLILLNIEYKMSISLREKSITFFMDLFALVIIIIVIQAFFSLVFRGSFRGDFRYLLSWTTPLFIIIITAFLHSGKWLNLIWGTVGLVDVIIIVSIIDLLMKKSPTIPTIDFVLSLIWIVISIITVFYKNIRLVVLFNFCFFIFTVLVILSPVKNLSLSLGISLFIISILIVLASINSFNSIIKREKIKKTEINSNQKKSVAHSIDNLIKKYIVTISTVIFLTLIGYAYHYAYDAGSYFKANVPQKAYDEIKYNDNGATVTIKGVVVSNKDGVYYISTDKKQLVTIKSTIIVTKPQ